MRCGIVFTGLVDIIYAELPFSATGFSEGRWRVKIFALAGLFFRAGNSDALAECGNRKGPRGRCSPIKREPAEIRRLQRTIEIESNPGGQL